MTFPLSILPSTATSYDHSHLFVTDPTQTRLTATISRDNNSKKKGLGYPNPLQEQVQYLAPDRPPDPTLAQVEAQLRSYIQIQIRSNIVIHTGKRLCPENTLHKPNKIIPKLTTLSLKNHQHYPSNLLSPHPNFNFPIMTTSNTSNPRSTSSSVDRQQTKNRPSSKHSGKGRANRKHQSPPSISTHFKRQPSPANTAMDVTTPTPKQPRSPSSSGINNENERKKSVTRGTPERTKAKDITVSPDSTDGPINLPPQIQTTTGSHNESFSPYKDRVTKSTPNSLDAAWEDLSVSTSATDPKQPGNLSPLTRKKKLSTNILTGRNGSSQKDALSLSSSGSSTDSSTKYDDTQAEESDDTEALLIKLRKSTAKKNKKKTTYLPHTLTNKASPVETDQVGARPKANSDKDLVPSNDDDTVMSVTKEATSVAATCSTISASTASTSTTSTGLPPLPPSSRQAIMEAANTTLANSRSYDYLKEGKVKKTTAWKDLSDRHKSQNKAFTHYEGCIDMGTADEKTIQDGIAINFGPAAKEYFSKSWESPYIDKDKLAEFSKTLIAATEPIYQDARNTLIKLAQTSPERFDEKWSYSTGFITNCKEGILWSIANHIYGSQWVFLQPQLLPKPKPKPISKEQRNARFKAQQPQTRLIKGAGVFLSRAKGQNPSTFQSLEAVSGKAPRPFHTFSTLMSQPLSSGGTEGETQLVENFNLAMEILLDSDKTVVIYVWPQKLDQNKTVQPYSRKHLDDSYSKAKKIASKAELLRYVSSAYVSEGNKSFLKIYCGHNDPHTVLVSDLVRQTLQSSQMNLYAEALQATTSRVCGWLLGADTKSFNCDHFTELLRSLPKFQKLPVASRRRMLKMKSEDVLLDRTDPNTVYGIVILCDGNFLKETNIAMKATFNRSSPKAIADRPDGLNFKYIEYYGEAKSKSPTHKQAVQITKAKAKQKKWMFLQRRIRIDGIQGIDFAILLPDPDSTPAKPLPDLPTTLRQIITNLKCQSNYKYPIFNQIHEQRDKSITAVCHRDQHSEGSMVLGHLPVLLKERYGSRTEAWFTQQMNDSTKGYYFCSDSGQVIHDDDEEEEDLFADFCTELSPALAAIARAKGEIIDEDYDGNLDDIDLEDTDDPPIKLDMQIMFNTSTLGEGGGFDDSQSVGTMMTGTSRATAIIAKIPRIGGTLTKTDDEISGVTTATTSVDSTTKNPAATAASKQQTGVNGEDPE